MRETKYLVTVVFKSQQVKTPFGITDLKMDWADGMCGAIPVFNDLESALKYADNDEILVSKIEYTKD